MQTIPVNGACDDVMVHATAKWEVRLGLFDCYFGTFHRSFVSLSYLDPHLTLTYLQGSNRLKTSRIFSTPICKYDAEQAAFESTFEILDPNE